MNYIAVDPGVGGGIAFQIDGEVGFWPMVEADTEIVAMLRQLIARCKGDCTVAIEDVPKFVGPIPGSVAAVLFMNFGIVRGAVLSFCARMVLVRPHNWQKYFSLGTKKDCGDNTTKWKNKLKAEAMRRFPQVKVTLKTADALLILEWARRTQQ